MDYKRAISIILLFILVIFAPYWMYLPALALALIYFPFFWEGIVLALFVDVLFGFDTANFLKQYPFSLSACIILIVLPYVKKRLRLNV
jgi:hypothetical protein